MLSGASISIFVPAYNAAGFVGKVIDRIPDEVWPNVISCWVINDGSTDNTAKEIEELARIHEKVQAVQLDKNCGYGGTVREGLSLCRKDQCDVAVCLHADGQYPPESIPEFAGTMQQDGYDILQGSRIASGTALSGGMPLYKFIAGKALTFFENIVLGLNMTDYHSGFLCYSRKAFQSIPFDRLSASFDFDLEVIASARARGLKVGELPIPTRYADEKSHLNPVNYGMRVLGVMGKYLVGGYR